MTPMTLQAAAWNEAAKPKSLPDGLYNKIVDNQNLLQNILQLSQAEVENTINAFKNPAELEQVLRALVNRGFIITDQNTEDLTKFKQNLADVFDIGLNTGTTAPPAASAIVQTTMVDSVMQLVTQMDTDLKKSVGKILADGYAQKKFPADIVKQMSNEIGISQERARKIATTETMRGSNAASWTQNHSEGMKYFVVDHRSAACKLCIREFSGRVFKISETRYIPPIHPFCACVPIFFATKAEAQKYAKRIQKRNKLERAELEKQGYKLPKDGTGPNLTGKEQAKIVKQVGKEQQKTSENPKPKTSKQLTPSEKKAIDSYLEDGNKGSYDLLNKYLRTGKVGSPDLYPKKDMLKDIKNLDRAISKNKLDSDMVLWRGVGHQQLTFKKGGSYSDKGYMSTSKNTLDMSVFSDTDTILKIKMPKNSTGLDLSKLNPREAEVLLPRGSKFKMVKQGKVTTDWGEFKYIEISPVKSVKTPKTTTKQTSTSPKSLPDDYKLISQDNKFKSESVVARGKRGSVKEGVFRKYYYSDGIDDITILFKKGLPLKFQQPEEILKAYKTLSPTLKGSINRIVAIGSKGHTLGYNSGLINDDICIAPRAIGENYDKLRHTISHESTHAWDGQFRPKLIGNRIVRPEKPFDWVDIMIEERTTGKPMFCSDYARSTGLPTEDLAESGALYNADPKKFKKDFPKRYEALKKVM